VRFNSAIRLALVAQTTTNCDFTYGFSTLSLQTAQTHCQIAHVNDLLADLDSAFLFAFKIAN